MTKTVYTITGERCDCGEPQEFCYWCDRPTPACPACGLPQVDEDTEVCGGEDGTCVAYRLYQREPR